MMKAALGIFMTAMSLWPFASCSEKTGGDSPTTEEQVAVQPRIDKEGPKSVLILSSSPRRGGMATTSAVIIMTLSDLTAPQRSRSVV